MECLLPVALLLLLACSDPASDPGPAADLPKPEHPRPDWRREAWTNLNGSWAFGHDPDDIGISEAWYAQTGGLGEEILVPFPFEAPASGLGDPWPEDGSALHATTDPTFQGVSWYQRSFLAPTWGEPRTFVVFGAVDWRATVWLNGIELGSHEGGWLPFEVELTQALHPGVNQLTVRVEDRAEDEPDTLIGKQGGAWYTRSSGIWQTVYLEGRPEAYLVGARFHPDWQTGRVELDLDVEGEAQAVSVEITDPRGGRVTWEGALDGELAFVLTELFPEHPGPALWSPADPALYEVTLRLEQDEVETYFGVRGLGVAWAPGHGPDDDVPVADQFQVFTLNGEPLYLRGVLDQNYHPDGLLTYPDEEALVGDLQIARAMGFNLLRVHLMHPEPRKLWHADRLGLLVMQDIPSPYTFLDNTPGTPYRDRWRTDVEAAWRRDHNHPSIVSWVLFNEAWGLQSPGNVCENGELQGWVLDSVDFARALDPSRWIEDESTTDVLTGVFDHTDTDLTSWHFYGDDWPTIAAHLDEVLAGSTIGGDHLYCEGWQHQGQPLLLSEFAGAGCYETVGLEGAEIAAQLLGWVDAIRARPRIAGYIFTQLTDVEWERNGLMAYDRSAKDLGLVGLDGLELATGADALVLSGLPGQYLAAGETVEVEVSLARGGDGTRVVFEPVSVSWTWLRAGNENWQAEVLDGGSLEAEAGWGLTHLGTIAIEGPGQDAALYLVAKISGEPVAATERRFPASGPPSRPSSP
jgi:beta-galactosidase/beta-glucuronidase